MSPPSLPPAPFRESRSTFKPCAAQDLFRSRLPRCRRNHLAAGGHAHFGLLAARDGGDRGRASPRRPQGSPGNPLCRMRRRILPMFTRAVRGRLLTWRCFRPWRCISARLNVPGVSDKLAQISTLNDEAQVFLKQNDFSSASDLLLRAEDIDPRNPTTLKNLAETYNLVNDSVKAKAYWQRLVDLGPGCGDGLRRGEGPRAAARFRPRCESAEGALHAGPPDLRQCGGEDAGGNAQWRGPVPRPHGVDAQGPEDGRL